MDLLRLVEFQSAHSAWALASLIDAAAGLPAGEIERDLGIGPGGLRENLAHTLEAMFFFADNFAGRSYAERPGFARRASTLDGLRALLAEADPELRGAMLAACRRGLGERVEWATAEAGWLPAPAALAQVFDHAALHRTQCINMLKRLGVRPVPDLDPLTFAGLARKERAS